MIDVGLDASDLVSARAVFGDRAVSDNLAQRSATVFEQQKGYFGNKRSACNIILFMQTIKVIYSHARARLRSPHPCSYHALNGLVVRYKGKR
jgi:hypothetical protein